MSKKAELRPFIVFWLPWYLYLIAIFIYSCYPRPEQVLGIELHDFWAHPLEYLILGLLTYRVFKQSRSSLLSKDFYLRGLVFCVLYAASDEWHQSFVPTRNASWFDFGLDSIGSVLAIYLHRFFVK